jgi:prepilin-type processing-associated H-X9-DG protein/prepilin-type N-terminal cleavage/methylation domain-containing protein
MTPILVARRKTGYTSHQMTSAFTLMELLVVITIIALLAGMLLPAISQVRTAAKGSICKSNERQVYIAYHSYAEDWEGLLPRQDTVTAYNPNDVQRGQSSAINEQSCSQYTNHHPKVMVCPEVLQRVVRTTEAWTCFTTPTYWPNTCAWVGWSQFTKPQTNSPAGASRPASNFPLLIENEPANTGGYHWDFAPSTRFLWLHNGRMNTLYFDGHVGSLRPAQLVVLTAGDA